ncbi:glycosyl transferase family 1 [Candidatus Viridilinea mediisalina]|uniref:Glycosyl transferase family 1 n=1 Tax=Candidatus Viridilinea mediisalina TaxID=2024553 RepID=A0A2A6RJW7_9CHLR|nr:glycosyl transferase family 1 [Candidatus Viridilinea mediisalina]
MVGAYQRKLEEIARLGVALTALVPSSWVEPRVGRLRLERRFTQGYQLEALPIALNGQHHIHFYPTLGAVLRRLRPQVLHIDEESFNLATFQAMRLGVALGARCCFYNYANINRYYPPPFNLFERYNLRHASHALACNQEAAAIIRRHGFTGPLTIVPQFGVDPELFQPVGSSPPASSHPASPPPAASPLASSPPASSPPTSAPPTSAPPASAPPTSAPPTSSPPASPPPTTRLTIGYLGRLVPEKGLLDLVAAFAALPAHVHLRLIGDGSQRSQLEQRAAALGLSQRIAIMPAVNSTAVPAALRALDILVLPSRTTPSWKEQFGRILIEAMSCGVPVVGSNSGEIPHVIGDAGLIFAEGDIAALRSQLMRLVEDAPLRHQLAQRGRQRVLTHYTQAAIAQRHVAIYRDMLEA